MKKSVDKSKDKRFASALSSEYKTCEICGEVKPDVKYRKLYDYINGETDVVMFCGVCECSISDDV